MSIYIVSRVFSRKERPNPADRRVFYGWSDNKNTIKAFLKQRDPKKYECTKYDSEEFPENGIDGVIDNPTECMIDYTKLKFSSNKQEIMFYTTMRELMEAEKRIQNRFHEMCSISDVQILKLYLSLDPYYLEALQLIGFIPEEVDELFDSADPSDDLNGIQRTLSEIETAYGGEVMPPSECPWKYMNPPGLGTISSIGSKILYSVENFVTALRDDL